MAFQATHRPSETITTERLLLRPLAPTDSDGVFAIRSDPKVLFWTEPETREKSDSWLKARLKSPRCLTYTVSLLPSDSSPSTTLPSRLDPSSLPIIGLTGAHTLPEVGHIFRPAFWGKGYATEALKAWVDMYWRKYPDGHPVLEGAERGYLKAVTGPGGEGSRGVLRKCGFRWWGEEEVGDDRKGAKERGERIVLEEVRMMRPGDLGW